MRGDRTIDRRRLELSLLLGEAGLGGGNNSARGAARFGFPSRMRQSDSVDCGGGGRKEDVRQIEKSGREVDKCGHLYRHRAWKERRLRAGRNRNVSAGSTFYIKHFET